MRDLEERLLLPREECMAFALWGGVYNNYIMRRLCWGVFLVIVRWCLQSIMVDDVSKQMCEH